MRRASSSILASGCAFTTTACRLSTPSDDPTVQFSATINRLSDEMKANFGRLGTQMNALDANVKAEVKDLRTEVKDVRTQMNALDAKMNALKAEMQDIKKSINSDTQSWFKTNERIIYVYCIAGIVALVYAVQYQYHGLEVKVARALESSQTTSELLVGAMSGKVFTKKVRRVARKKRIEPSS